MHKRVMDSKRYFPITHLQYLMMKKRQELVPFAKAYSGLSNSDMKVIDSKIKKITEESYGPVKKVRPEIIVELLFDSISESKRHKSGIAVRFLG